MPWKAALGVGVVIVVALLITAYFAPSESGYEPSVDEVIQHAQQVAYDLYLRGGAEPIYGGVVLEPARSKMKMASVRTLSPADISSRLRPEGLKVIPPDFFPALLPERNNLILEIFQRNGATFVVTFSYRDDKGGLAVTIPGKGPLWFSVASEFVRVPNDSVVQRALRKVANAPVVRSIVSSQVGSSWRLGLLDFRLNADLADLVKWLEEHRAELVQRAESGEKRLIRSLNDPDLMGRVMAAMADGEIEKQKTAWVQSAMDAHARQVTKEIAEQQRWLDEEVARVLGR